MAHAAFDTLKYVETLTQAGIAEKQAKALAKVQNEVLVEALDNTVATKADLQAVEQTLRADLQAVEQALRTEIQILSTEIKTVEQTLKLEIMKVRSEQKLIKWMLGLIMAGIASLILKAFFG